MKKQKQYLIAFALLCMVISAAAGQSVVAFMGMENMGGDPRHDYLRGLSEGLLLYDFSRSESVVTVNRANLDAVLNEQKLALSGIVDREKAVKVGRLTGADYLLSGGYTFLGDEVMFSLTLVDVETGEARTVASRGSGENTLHDLAEQALIIISGETADFTDSNGDRSILSLKDTKPGTIALHSNLIDAEIYLDGAFIGYTTGDSRKAFIIEDLPPGVHTLETRLGADFGTVKLPEVLFRNWHAEVQVQSGKKSVVRANETHFNEVVYRLMYLCSESKTIYDSSTEAWTLEEDITFTSRDGKEIPGDVSAAASWNGGSPLFEGRIRSGGGEYSFSLKPGDEAFTEESGGIKIKAEIRQNWENSANVSISVVRTDLYQGMHRDEGKTAW